MSDDYEDDFIEALPSPSAAGQAAAASASANPLRKSVARANHSQDSAAVASANSASLQANIIQPAASTSLPSSSSSADAARIRELTAKVESLEREMAASRVKLRRAGRPVSAAASDDPSAAASSSAASAAPELGCNAIREISFASLQLGEQISGGGFCLLYKSRWQAMDVAVKRLFDPNLTDRLRAEFNNEVRMLSNLQHPHIVQVLAQVSCPPSLCIVTEFMARGSLFHVLHQSAVTLSKARLAAMSLQLACALRFLSGLGVVHRDIKSHNVLADEFLKLKLCDFGMATEARLLASCGEPSAGSSRSGSSSSSHSSVSSAVPEGAGTPHYMAPELFQGVPASFASDMFAFGTLLNELWSRAPPFDGLSVAEIRAKVLAGERPRVAATVPREVAQIIKEATAQAPADRTKGFEKIVQLFTSLQSQSG